MAEVPIADKDVARVEKTILATPENPPLRASTTAEEDLRTANQRKINLIWEYTQMIISLVVVIATMSVGVYNAISGQNSVDSILSIAFGTVIGFYFSRTNHQNVGGIQQGR